MSEAAEILVVILSVFLALFLLLSIILVVMLIRVTRKIQAFADAVKSTAEHIEDAVSSFTKFTSPIILAKMVMNQFKKTKGE